MDKKDIVEKIQKLLSLANSSNEHEARLAAQKATELLTKHNLSMQDVEPADRDYKALHYSGTKSRVDMAHKYIFRVLNRYFFIQVVRGGRINPFTLKRTATWSFFGEEHNVKIAHFVFEFLDKSYDKLYKEFKKANETDRYSRNSFYVGLTAGLMEQLKTGKEKVEQEAGLVVIKDPGIDKFVKDTIGKTVNLPSRVSIQDSNAVEKGFEQGKNLRIAVGLGEKNGGPTKSLGGKS